MLRNIQKILLLTYSIPEHKLQQHSVDTRHQPGLRHVDYVLMMMQQEWLSHIASLYSIEEIHVINKLSKY